MAVAGIEMAHECGWGQEWPTDVAGDKDGPWMWQWTKMAHGCGWGQEWPTDVAGDKDGPWMWQWTKMAHGCGWGAEMVHGYG